jgi:hypothetical protein
MSTPVVAQAPCSIFVAVENPDLAINGAGRATVAVRVEGTSLDEVAMAMRNQVEGRVVVCRGRDIVQNRRRHCRRLH